VAVNVTGGYVTPTVPPDNELGPVIAMGTALVLVKTHASL
jgi:hypothetical protein